MMVDMEAWDDIGGGGKKVEWSMRGRKVAVMAWSEGEAGTGGKNAISVFCMQFLLSVFLYCSTVCCVFWSLSPVLSVCSVYL